MLSEEQELEVDPGFVRGRGEGEAGRGLLAKHGDVCRDRQRHPAQEQGDYLAP